MTIKQHGGIFGRNPTFNEIGGTLTTAAQPNITSLGTQTSNLAFADGNGIDFSATAGTGTSELFDDYEEGAWTPVAKTDGGPPSGQVYAGTNTGHYVKIGRQVIVNFRLVLTTAGTIPAGNAIISGLPFTSANVVAASVGHGVAAGFSNLGQNTSTVTFAVRTVSSDMSLTIQSAFDGSTGAASQAIWQNSCSITGTATYRV